MAIQTLVGTATDPIQLATKRGNMKKEAKSCTKHNYIAPGTDIIYVAYRHNVMWAGAQRVGRVGTVEPLYCRLHSIV